MNKRLGLSIAAISALIMSHLSYAGAFQFYELGAPVNGTAGVGQAIVSDASIAYFNPAGMGAVANSEVMVGTQLTLPYTNFSPNAAHTFSGGNGGTASTLVPGAGSYVVYHYSSKFSVGSSLTAPYGGMLNYDDYWVGRYYAQQMTYYTLNLNPAASYHVNDWLLLGAGASIEYANLYQTVALPLRPGLDGQLTLKLDNFSPGFNLGAMIEPSVATKIGIAYRSQIIHRLRGGTYFLNIAAAPSTVSKLVMPANIIVSLYQQFTGKISVLAEAGWANWSSMKSAIVQIDGYSIATPQNWHDTYRVGLGGRYQLHPCLLLQAGVSYDSSPTSSARRTPNLPMDRQIRAAAGAVYTLVKGMSLGLSYEYINLGAARIDNVTPIGILAGHYARDYANVIQTSLNVAF